MSRVGEKSGRSKRPVGFGSCCLLRRRKAQLGFALSEFPIPEHGKAGHRIRETTHALIVGKHTGRESPARSAVAEPAIRFGKPSPRPPSPALSRWWMAAVAGGSTGACRSRSGSAVAVLAFRSRRVTGQRHALPAQEPAYGRIVSA
jgi:hypothetical protein